jgi:hypothetical protein
MIGREDLVWSIKWCANERCPRPPISATFFEGGNTMLRNMKLRMKLLCGFGVVFMVFIATMVMY